MSEHRTIAEPGEMVYAPRPSWAPIFFAFAIAVLVAGIYANGFMVPAWVFSIIAAVVLLFAFRHLIRGAIRSFFELPRVQHTRGAVLPVETIGPPQP
jgi:hypothetical protein